MGKTTLVYHVACMLRELGLRVVVADLDPQSNLTTAFLSEEQVAELWQRPTGTALTSLQPLINRLGDILPAELTEIAGIALLAGDLGLTNFEDRLAMAWRDCMGDRGPDRSDGFRVMTAFYRMLDQAAHKAGADVVIMDVGPNLGAINRAAMVASDYVVVPVGADLFSLRGLANLGPALREWRRGWAKRIEQLEGEVPVVPMPSGGMQPLGYVVLQHAVRDARPVKAYQRWVDRIPATYYNGVLGEQGPPEPDDGAMLGTIKHYRSLMPLAQDARKPVFKLKPADGAIGGHTQAVLDAYREFEHLAKTIMARAGLPLPD